MEYPDSLKYGFDPAADEPNFEEYQSDPSCLDKYLQKFEGYRGLAHWTYPKLRDSCREVCQNYFGHLTSDLGFELLPGDRVIDAGAHHGFFSLGAASAGADVVAVEPNPINIDVIRRSLALHADYRVALIQAAVGGCDGMASFNFGKTSTTGALHRSGRDWKRTLTGIEVSVVSLSSLVDGAQTGAPRVKLLKCDTEGGEYDFIMNAPLEALRACEYLAFEVHPTLHSQPGELLQYLSDSGYSVLSYPGAMGTAIHGCSDVFAKRR